jgi:hypothetical protein
MSITAHALSTHLVSLAEKRFSSGTKFNNPIILVAISALPSNLHGYSFLRQELEKHLLLSVIRRVVCCTTTSCRTQHKTQCNIHIPLA